MTMNSLWFPLETHENAAPPVGFVLKSEVCPCYFQGLWILHSFNLQMSNIVLLISVSYSLDYTLNQLISNNKSGGIK